MGQSHKIKLIHLVSGSEGFFWVPSAISQTSYPDYYWIPASIRVQYSNVYVSAII